MTRKMTEYKTKMDIAKLDVARQRLVVASSKGATAVLDDLNTSYSGLQEVAVEQMRLRYGSNKITRGKKDSLLKRLWDAFVNPFTAILFVLAVVSFVTDVAMAAPSEKDAMTVTIILAMVLISGLLRYVQETRSGNAAERLSEMVETTTAVEREPDGRGEIPLEAFVQIFYLLIAFYSFFLYD